MNKDYFDMIKSLNQITDFISRYVVGLKDLLQLLLIALLSEGHILIKGPPGTGKTLTARLLSLSIGGVFKRVQMVPDILPSDILGSFYYDLQKGQWIFREGPIFSNILLVDDLTRAPPRTQSALLEAMQEGRVSIEGRTFELPKPFLVIATQVEAEEGLGEGVYQLSPTLLDRFAYSFRSYYVSPEEEIKILDRVDDIDDIIRSSFIKPIMTTNDLIKIQSLTRDVYIDPKIKKYIVDIITYFRKAEDLVLKPSTRATIWLLKGARALALLEGMEYVIPDHVKKIVYYVLGHRILLKEGYYEKIDIYDYIRKVLSKIEVPKI
jgi:MoxR-like ATPase